MILHFDNPKQQAEEVVLNAWCRLTLEYYLLGIILTLGLILWLMKKQSKRNVNEAASALGKRSAEVRQKKWGKLGGRPKKTETKGKGKQ